MPPQGTAKQEEDRRVLTTWPPGRPPETAAVDCPAPEHLCRQGRGARAGPRGHLASCARPGELAPSAALGGPQLQPGARGKQAQGPAEGSRGRAGPGPGTRPSLKARALTPLSPRGAESGSATCEDPRDQSTVHSLSGGPRPGLLTSFLLFKVKWRPLKRRSKDVIFSNHKEKTRIANV